MPSVCVSLISGAVRNCPIAVILALKRPSGIDVKAVRPLTRSGSADLDAPGRARASFGLANRRHTTTRTNLVWSNWAELGSG